jgi:hypothetical protein
VAASARVDGAPFGQRASQGSETLNKKAEIP